MDTESLRLPDRSHVGPGLRGSIFLFRQPFVLWPAIAGCAACLAGIALLSVNNERATLQSVAVLVALTPLLGLGFAVSTGLPGFMLWRALAASPPRLSLDDGEETLVERRANHFLGDEARGGRVFVTTRRLVFVPHRFNVQLAAACIPLDDVTAARWARILGPYVMQMSSILEIATSRGPQTFVVDRAERVAGLVDALRRVAEDARASEGRALVGELGLAS